jgi:hypothetical protein
MDRVHGGIVGWLVVDVDDDVAAKLFGWLWSFRGVVSKRYLIALLGKNLQWRAKWSNGNLPS